MKYFAANYNCVIDRMERISVKVDTYNEAVEWIAANGPRNCDGDSIAMVSHDYYEATDYPVSDTVVDVVETVVEAVRPTTFTEIVTKSLKPCGIRLVQGSLTRTNGWWVTVEMPNGKQHQFEYLYGNADSVAIQIIDLCCEVSSDVDNDDIPPHEMTNVVYQTCCLVNQTMTIPEAPYKHGQRVRSERHITLYTKALARLREDSAPQNDIDNCVAFLEFECNI